MQNEFKPARSDQPEHGFHFKLKGVPDGGVKSNDTDSVHPSVDSEAEYNEKVEKARAEWERRRKAGFDDYGTEMDKDAGVWKAYVVEADRVDKEMVQGWNKSLDVLLIFVCEMSPRPPAIFTCIL